jgi:hypothetical protein
MFVPAMSSQALGANTHQAQQRLLSKSKPGLPRFFRAIFSRAL